MILRRSLLRHGRPLAFQLRTCTGTETGREWIAYPPKPKARSASTQPDLKSIESSINSLDRELKELRQFTAAQPEPEEEEIVEEDEEDGSTDGNSNYKVVQRVNPDEQRVQALHLEDVSEDYKRLQTSRTSPPVPLSPPPHQLTHLPNRHPRQNPRLRPRPPLQPLHPRQQAPSPIHHKHPPPNRLAIPPRPQNLTLEPCQQRLHLRHPPRHPHHLPRSHRLPPPPRLPHRPWRRPPRRDHPLRRHAPRPGPLRRKSRGAGEGVSFV